MSSNGVKAAATALIRMMRAGKLSAPSIYRAARAMDPGKFRFVRNLGRGQFNLADEVVGNVGGHAGQMVRKLPAHAYRSPQEGYKGLKQFVDNANRQLPTSTGAPAIAPYVAVNHRGAFQQLANQAVHSPEDLARRWRTWGFDGPPGPSAARVPTAGAHRLMNDLHEGNIGPGGQIIDFTAPGVGWADSTASRVHTSPWKLVADNIPGGRDQLANLAAPTAAQRAMNRQINNGIRRFYDKLTPAQREVALSDPIDEPQRWMLPPGGAGEFERRLGEQAARRGIMQQKQLPARAPDNYLDRRMNTSELGFPGPQSPFSAWNAGLQPAPRQRIWPWWLAGGAAAGGGSLVAEYLRSQGKR